MPVGVTAAASAIALPRSRTSTIACSAVIDAGAGGGGDLADAVAGDRADLAEGVGRVREERERGDQAGGDQQRLGDRGVADRLGVGLGAVVGQVEAGDGRQPVEARGEGRVLEPGREETGGLGALAGSDDDEHGLHSAACGHRSLALRARTKLRRAILCRIPTKAIRLSVRSRLDCRPSTSAISQGEGVAGVGRGESPVRSATWRSR